MSRPAVYMDYNATTPLHPEVRAVILEAMDDYGNASSMHGLGRQARDRIETARAEVAALLNANPAEIIFTAGGSESNNTVLNMFTCGSSSCQCAKGCRSEIVTTVIEHPSVLNAAEYLTRRGIKVHFVPVDRKGRVDEASYRAALSENTALVSVMMANNEIGTIQDIARLAGLAHQAGAFFHTDAVQTVGKLPVDVRALDVDYLSLSAHKFHGPKGVGALYVKKRAPFCPLLHGGHQEEGRRAGTLNTWGIAGMGLAARLAGGEQAAEIERLSSLRDSLRRGIEASIEGVVVNGDPDAMLPGTLNVSFPGAEGEALLLYLDLENICVSTGSACASGSLEPSHVLLALGIGAELAHGSLRFSLGRESNQADVNRVLEVLPPIVARIRKMSTAWKPGRKAAV